MINLSAVGKKKADTKTEYPRIADPAAPAIAAAILDLTDQAEAVTASLDLHKAELVSHAKPEFFARYVGRVDVPSSMAAVATTGREVLVSMSNRYKAASDLALLSMIMGERASRFLRESFKLELDSAKIPMEKQQQVVDELVSVLTKHGCADALTAKQSTTPTEDFHIGRHTAFSVDENIAIDGVMPMVVAVKTKGRK